MGTPQDLNMIFYGHFPPILLVYSPVLVLRLPWRIKLFLPFPLSSSQGSLSPPTDPFQPLSSGSRSLLPLPLFLQTYSQAASPPSGKLDQAPPFRHFYRSHLCPEKKIDLIFKWYLYSLPELGLLVCIKI